VSRIMVVGSGWRFTSGISYYTCRLANELRKDHSVAALMMRDLVPRVAYPGRRRVGNAVNTALDYDPEVRTFDGVDWYWVPSMMRALNFMREFRPDVVIFQWWTGAVLHSYRMLAAQASRLGASVIIEFHEVQDTGEAGLPFAAGYVRRSFPKLLRRASGAIAHSSFDVELLHRSYPDLALVPTVIAPHGPYDQHSPAIPVQRAASDVTRLLFFGTIRPYKGLEDLLTAFDRLVASETRELELHIVGETWEGWTLPLRMAEQSSCRSRIQVINRYVSDDEVSQAFAGADLVVLPYHRSSSSGPLHIAMAAGLPVVVSEVGGLVEASEGYQGRVLVPPADPAALCDGIRQGLSLVGRRYADVRSWDDTRQAVAKLVGSLDGGS
jgi:glycosyltransferase involved in cell wall biosynthesis